MANEMQNLAQAFVNSGQRSDQQSFSIHGSQEEIVITVVRTASRQVKDGMNKLARAHLVPYGSGAVCGACGGTGRL